MSDLKLRVFRGHGSRTSYYQHDNRDDNVGGHRRRRDNCFALDVQMETDNEPLRRTRFTPYEARGGRRRNRRQRGRGCNFGGFNQRNDRRSRWNGNWFRIMIRNINNVDKNTILKSIMLESPVLFTPINFKYEGSCATFYIEGQECAEAIEKLNGKIVLSNGLNMTIKLFLSPKPTEIQLPDTVMSKIKQVIAKRCNFETKTLDLSSFANDCDLRNDGIFISLNIQTMFSDIIEIIEELIPDLFGLNLTDNKLTCNELKLMSDRLKNIKILLLGGNNFIRLKDLDLIKELSLEELVLPRNPLCDPNKDQTAFVSAVRQKFPKVVRLDGKELPSVYGFEDVEPEILLPISKKNFLTDEIVPQFLEQYFTVYDSGDRQNLMAAYHNYAQFSMSAVPFLKNSLSAPNRAFKQFKAYSGESRNLLRVTKHTQNQKLCDAELSRYQKLLHQGKVNIISFLSQLPKTQHDPMSFSIDVPHTSNSLLVVSCSGVFKEVESKLNPLFRAFTRVFILVPQGVGFCIINEMMFVTHGTYEQTKAAFKVLTPSPSLSGTIVSTTEEHKQKVLMFSQKSGMNVEWSMKCLQDNNWDFGKSASVFQEYNKNGQIPAEAFIL